MSERAHALLGTPFKICGRDPEHGLDCCGLMLECYEYAGVDVRFIDLSKPYSGTWWEGSRQQVLLDGLRRIMDVTLTTMLPLSLDVGTWILYSYDGLMVAHMALYVGGGAIIHSFNERLGCVKQLVGHRYWSSKLIGFATLKEVIRHG